jgi:membrane protein YqaA with SNARE-associated domain
MGLIWIIAVACWAVAEATFFFIVPDVLITVAVLRFGPRAGVRLAIVAAIFAALGGLGMWFWGYGDAEAARSAVLHVPAVGPDLLARAHREITQNWFVHLVLGAVTGVPYKLYAVEAGAHGLTPFLFVPASIAARLTRFLVAVGLTTLMSEALTRLNKPEWRYRVLALAWCLVYGTYFYIRARA